MIDTQAKTQRDYMCSLSGPDCSLCHMFDYGLFAPNRDCTYSLILCATSPSLIAPEQFGINSPSISSQLMRRFPRPTDRLNAKTAKINQVNDAWNTWRSIDLGHHKVKIQNAPRAQVSAPSTIETSHPKARMLPLH